MNKNSIQTSFNYKKLHFLDGLELFEAENDTDFFPFHKHDTFCISIITSGTEIYNTKDNSFIIPANTIGISQENEVHKNTSLNIEGYSYKTLYINKDILSYFNKGKEIINLNRTINNDILFKKLQHLFNNNCSLKNFEKTLQELCFYSTNNVNDFGCKLSTDKIHEHIASDFNLRIETDSLAKMYNMSKYHFTREFKKQTGVTPQNYVTLYKLEQAKKALLSGTISIKEVVYDFGFYDMSHFSKIFKKFYGVSPLAYVKSF